MFLWLLYLLYLLFLLRLLNRLWKHSFPTSNPAKESIPEEPPEIPQIQQEPPKPKKKLSSRNRRNRKDKERERNERRALARAKAAEEATGEDGGKAAAEVNVAPVKEGAELDQACDSSPDQSFYTPPSSEVTTPHHPEPDTESNRGFECNKSNGTETTEPDHNDYPRATGRTQHPTHIANLRRDRTSSRSPSPTICLNLRFGAPQQLSTSPTLPPSATRPHQEAEPEGQTSSRPQPSTPIGGPRTLSSSWDAAKIASWRDAGGPKTSLRSPTTPSTSPPQVSAPPHPGNKIDLLADRFDLGRQLKGAREELTDKLRELQLTRTNLEQTEHYLAASRDMARLYYRRLMAMTLTAGMWKRRYQDAEKRVAELEARVIDLEGQRTAFQAVASLLG